MYQNESVQDRTEKILKLKEFERHNKEYMYSLSNIMGYSDANARYNLDSDSISYGERLEHPQKSIQNQTNVKYFTLKLRLIFCVVIFFIMFLDKSYFHCISADVYNRLNTFITTDYSGRVIDFMDNFTYTFDYEKTSFK